MRASETAYTLIKSFEALRLRAYQDSGKVLTIGWGSTKNVKQGDVISTDEAIGKLIRDITDAEAGVRGLLKVAVNQNQFDALVSFVFNLGAGDEVQGSALFRKINAKDPAASTEFLRWNHGRVKGKLQVLHGLTRRRVTERRLFDTGELVIEA